MKQSVDENDFVEAFNLIRPENFSRAGLRAMFEYLEEMEEGTGEEIELDVIALCCDFSEYPNALEIAEENDFEADDDDDADEREKKAIAYLNDRTTVITFEGGVIVGAF